MGVKWMDLMVLWMKKWYEAVGPIMVHHGPSFYLLVPQGWHVETLVSYWILVP